MEWSGGIIRLQPEPACGFRNAGRHERSQVSHACPADATNPALTLPVRRVLRCRRGLTDDGILRREPKEMRWQINRGSQ
jgi:hypothetical protein